MGVIPDHEIKERMSSGSLRIDNYFDGSLTPNGYDLRISEVSIQGNNEKISSGTVIIPPKSMFYVSTMERVALPSDICAQLWLRTSWMRKGILASLGKVDAGFDGTLTLMGYNMSDKNVELPIGSRFVQIVFEKMESAAELTYEKRSGHYQGEKGVTLAPCSSEGPLEKIRNENSR